MEAARELLPECQPEPGCHHQVAGLRHQRWGGRNWARGQGHRSCADGPRSFVSQAPALPDSGRKFPQSGADGADRFKLLLLDLEGQDGAPAWLWGLGRMPQG